MAQLAPSPQFKWEVFYPNMIRVKVVHLSKQETKVYCATDFMQRHPHHHRGFHIECFIFEYYTNPTIYIHKYELWKRCLYWEGRINLFMGLLSLPIVSNNDKNKYKCFIYIYHGIYIMCNYTILYTDIFVYIYIVDSSSFFYFNQTAFKFLDTCFS